MPHTSMHDLMLGMFLGGVLLASPPILLGLAIGGYALHRRRLDKAQQKTDLPGD